MLAALELVEEGELKATFIVGGFGWVEVATTLLDEVLGVGEAAR